MAGERRRRRRATLDGLACLDTQVMTISAVPLPRPRRLRGALAAALLLGVLAGAAPARADCPGAAPGLRRTSPPRRSASAARACCASRRPSPSAPTGRSTSPTRARTSSRSSRRAASSCARSAPPGTGPGELTSVGAVAVAADGTLFVADGTNRIDRFDPAGALHRLLRPRRQRPGRVPLRRRRRQRGGRGRRPRRLGGRSSTSPTPATTASSASAWTARNPRILVPPGILDVPQGLTVRGTRLTVADDRNHRLVVFDTGGRMLGDGRRRQGREPGPARAPLRRRLRRRRAPLRRRRPQPPRRALQRAAALPVQGPLGRVRDRARAASPTRAGSRSARRARSTSRTRATTASTSSTAAATCRARSARRAARSASSTRRWASRPTRAASAP